ncbi:hypothetical protein [Halalkalibacter hemicellulosilyticus]|uniref:Penicillin-binding protein n=1 Tax=Halalkalibacter hemicellulosilyticusJCM 9152 TaxID=1236971 RepID=W4QGH8_9BACI|nr:hypothetical protein [Halalkalibacter hemicellulosilyticus]GAE31220.1 hypothetical protein JCM9152_2675 [Halalkalibacter hemicellulosilyticusJCM 9152]
MYRHAHLQGFRNQPGYYQGQDQRFPFLPFLAGLAVGPVLFGGFGRPNVYAPSYGPNFGPQFGPNLGPQYGPSYGPNFGPYLGSPYGYQQKPHYVW